MRPESRRGARSSQRGRSAPIRKRPAAARPRRSTLAGIDGPLPSLDGDYLPAIGRQVAVGRIGCATGAKKSGRSTMELETVGYEVEDGVLTITLNRPDRLNAFTEAMGAELIEAFERADRDDEGG